MNTEEIPLNKTGLALVDFKDKFWSLRMELHVWKIITTPSTQTFFSPNAPCFIPKMQQKYAAPVPTEKNPTKYE